MCICIDSFLATFNLTDYFMRIAFEGAIFATKYDGINSADKQIIKVRTFKPIIESTEIETGTASK